MTKIGQLFLNFYHPKTIGARSSIGQSVGLRIRRLGVQVSPGAPLIIWSKTMSEKDNQINWDKIAEKFDMWLPQLKPVGEALLFVLDVQKGNKVIDIASGTGEPAIMLAKRMNGSVEITGIDAADGMVRAAQKQVVKESLRNISFHCMPAEKLAFEDK